MELKDSFVGRFDGVKFFRERKTENDVVIPPALIITDEQGDTWTLGRNYNNLRDMEFDVMRNDQWTGEYASRIEFRRGRVRIFNRMGTKLWSGRTFI